MPPAFRNHLVPTGCDTPASSAASSLLSPVAIARQNLICSSRPAAGGRPGEGNGARPDRADRRFRMLIATSNFRVLRRPLESALGASAIVEQPFHFLDGGIEGQHILAPWLAGACRRAAGGPQCPCVQHRSAHGRARTATITWTPMIRLEICLPTSPAIRGRYTLNYKGDRR